MLKRPAENEYGGHFGTYIRMIPEGNIVEIIAEQGKETGELIASLSEEQGNARYAEDKWSVKEVIGHIADTERIMSYRLLRIARGDATPLPGFDQDAFMRFSPFASWDLKQLAEEYRAVRNATLTLLQGLPENAWSRRGTASNIELTVRALAYIIAGHERHHVKIIRDLYLR